jgi:hypothetical protein
VLRVHEVERGVGKRKALAHVQVDELVAAAVPVEVGVEPTGMRVLAGTELELPGLVLPKVGLDLLWALDPPHRVAQECPHEQ